MQGEKRKASSCVHLNYNRASYEGALRHTVLSPCDSHLACLGCGLRSAGLEQHIQAHGANLQGHEVVLDARSSELYCISCADYVYGLEFDALRLAIRGAASPAIANGGGCDEQQGVSVLQPAIAAAAAAPPAEEVAAPFPTAATAAQPAPGAQAVQPAGTFQPLAGDGFPSGLRGLNNMGNTCFMNSVLQGLLHAPLLRNYYLLGCHCKQACPITADGGFCVSCELDEVFNEAYSGARTAYSPAQFLYTWWMLAGSHLGSYQQHDAHEFLLFVLEMLGIAGGTGGNISAKVFGGTLRSDVICTSCGHASTTQDPFTHLSLDIPPREHLIPAPILPRPTGNNTGGGKVAGGSKAGGAGKASGGGSGGMAGRAGAAAAAARRLDQTQGTAAAGLHTAVAFPRLAAATAAATPVPSSSADHCTSSDVEICDEAGGSISTLGNGGDEGGGGGGAQQEGGGNFPLLPNCHGALGAAALLPAPHPPGSAAWAGQQPDSMSQLEAASAVGGPGGLLDDDSEDAAQDTLSSPRMSRAGAAQLPAPRGGAAAARGRPPIPKSGRSRKKGGAKTGQARAWQGTPCESEGPGTMAMLGQNREASDTVTATQDALAAAGNLPGSQSITAVAAGAAFGAGGSGSGSMHPQLAGYQRWPAASLVGCLHRFVRQEALEPSERMQCSRCHSQHAVKQLSVRALPPVLVLHAKRFEHPGGLRAAARKLDTDLAFPLTGLDMRPFLSSSLLRARHGLPPSGLEPRGLHNPSFPTPPAQQHSPPSQERSAKSGPLKHSPAVAAAAAAGPSGSGSTAQQQGRGAAIDVPAQRPSWAGDAFLYDLYAVVCHRGSFQGGHYVAYVRGGDGRWYLCDDAWVVGVDESVVKSVQAYMLFYCRRGTTDFSC